MFASGEFRHHAGRLGVEFDLGGTTLARTRPSERSPRWFVARRFESKQDHRADAGV